MTTQKITSMTYTIADTVYCYSISSKINDNHYVVIDTNLDQVDNILVNEVKLTIKVNKVKYIDINLKDLKMTTKGYEPSSRTRKDKISMTHTEIMTHLLGNCNSIATQNPLIGLVLLLTRYSINDELDKSRILAGSLTAKNITDEIKAVEKILQDKNISYPLPLMKLINFLKFHDLY